MVHSTQTAQTRSSGAVHALGLCRMLALLGCFMSKEAQDVSLRDTLGE